MTFNPRLQSFLDKYLINVLSTSKRSHGESLITCDIPLSKLGAVATLEATFYNNIDNTSHRRMFESWMVKQTKDVILRQKYPAVQLAYEHYEAMKLWCESGKDPSEFKPLDSA